MQKNKNFQNFFLNDFLREKKFVILFSIFKAQNETKLKVKNEKGKTEIFTKKQSVVSRKIFFTKKTSRKKTQKC